MPHFRRKRLSPARSTGSRPPTPGPSRRQRKSLRFTKLLPRTSSRGNRAPVASPGANAPSFASSSSDPMDTTLNEPGSPRESCWETVRGVTRMGIDLVRESSDVFFPLRAVVGALSVLITNYDQTTANTKQIKDIEERVESLRGVLTAPASDQDNEERTRRDVLRQKLTGIIDELRQISEQRGLLKFLNNVNHTNILSGLVQDVAYAVMDYQTSMQQGIYVKAKRTDETTGRIDENTLNLIAAADLELLDKLDPVRGAGYQAGHHDTCLRGTREPVLDKIMQWAEDPQDKHIFWLNGLAGTGKSTIAQTFADMVARNETLGASFFCSRDYLDRKELKNIFPTLAHQLACRYPAFRSQITQVIRQDPFVAQNSLISQLKQLVIGPLSSTNISCTIVVDALDECVDHKPTSAFLSVLGRSIRYLPSVKFFITGRPEPWIRSGFRLPLLEPFTKVFLLHEVDLSSVDKDIRLYLQEKLGAVAKRSDCNVSYPWPSEGDLTALTEKSSGLFIFASTLARFIESNHHEPVERLKLILHPSDSTFHEGRAGIDLLYTQVLLHAFSDVNEAAVFGNLRRVLGAMILAFNPLSRVQIAEILGVNASFVATTLRHLHSVLLVPQGDFEEIRVFHKSFPDFLQDSTRCSDPEFFIDSALHHGDMALGCLDLLKVLESNPCDLPDFVMNREVVHLPELLEGKVGSATRYACGYWAMHVRSSPTTQIYATRLIASATEFFKKNVVPWVEVMSLENRLEVVVHSIYNLFDWLSRVNVPAFHLRSLAQDCLRFAMHFFHLIQQSARHIYHSALPLLPWSSALRNMPLCQGTQIAEFYGRSYTWGAVVRTLKCSSERFTCMTAFGRWIAVACDDNTVGIYDSITGALRLSLSPADPVQTMRGSPDGSILSCAHHLPSITLWDIQTGGPVYGFVLEWKVEDIAPSLEGRYLACTLFDGSLKVWEVANETGGATIRGDSPFTRLCWLEPEEHLAVATEEFVHVWDVVAGRVLQRFPTCGLVRDMVYSKNLDELATITTSGAESTVTIIDPRKGTSYTNRIQRQITCLAFSQTTTELICGVETHGLELFNTSTQRWRHFDHPAIMTSISPLSNGSLVANVQGSGVQLLDLSGGNAPFQQLRFPVLTVDPLDEGRIIAILTTGTRNHIALLESSNMSQLFTMLTPNDCASPDRTPVLCASLQHRVAVHCREEGNEEYVLLWRFDDEFPKWTVEVNELPSIGGISPNGTRFVTLHNAHPSTHIYLRNAQTGQLQAHIRFDPSFSIHTLEIEFESEDRFHTTHPGFRIPHVISWSESGTPSHSIVRHEQLPLVEQPQRHYDVDETGEWVVRSSERICWIPPGYIGSVERSYCWVGNALVMAGQDGKLRKLTFREQL